MNRLDNPVWHSLHEAHIGFCISSEGLKCYDPEICPFGGIVNTNVSEHLDHYAQQADNFFIVGDKPEYSDKLKLKNELVCLQMIIDEPIHIPVTEKIVPLNGRYEEELYELVNLVQPGYFRQRTVLMGEYCGIFKDNKLVAVAGERMKMHQFTEVSAIVTHPDYTGNGYAKQLTADRVNKIFMQSKTPYLHVAKSNTGAIALYEKLGFKIRREISFWNFTKAL